MDIFSWDGSISSSDFSLAARTFTDKWKTFNSSYPTWHWVAFKKQSWLASHEVDGYLSLENICLLKSSEEDHGEESCTREEETSCSMEEESIDSATLVHSCDREAHYYDFHIVYSASYRVPVLYFRACMNGGQPLALDEIEKELPACSAKVLSESKWTFITLESEVRPELCDLFLNWAIRPSTTLRSCREHPYLNRPWYKLHPCGTSEWMKLLFLSDAAAAPTKPRVSAELYLVSWFSVVGQVVGLNFPFEMMDDDNPL